MTGARVVPLVGRLLRHAVMLLDELHLPLRLQQLEHQRDRGAHDAAADDERVDLLRALLLENGLGLHHVVAAAER